MDSKDWGTGEPGKIGRPYMLGEIQQEISRAKMTADQNAYPPVGASLGQAKATARMNEAAQTCGGTVQTSPVVPRVVVISHPRPAIKNVVITLSEAEARTLMADVIGPQPLLYGLYADLLSALGRTV